MVFSRIFENIKQMTLFQIAKKLSICFAFFLKLQLEQDIAKVCAEFQRIPFIQFEEFRSGSQVHLLSKF